MKIAASDDSSNVDILFILIVFYLNGRYTFARLQIKILSFATI